MANNGRLEATMRWVEEHPDEHDQSIWAVRGSCGTKMCFAGAAATLAGAEIIWPEYGHVAVQVRYRDAVLRISRVARMWLGVDEDQSHWLFHMTEGAWDLREAVNAIKADPTWQPPFND